MFIKQVIYFEITKSLSEQCSLPPAAFLLPKITPLSLKARCEVPRLPPAFFWAPQTPPFSLKARCEVPRLPPAVFWAQTTPPFYLKARPRGSPGPPQSVPRPPRARPWLRSRLEAFQGGAPQAKWPKSMERLSKIDVSELIRQSSGSRGSSGSGGSKRAPEPTFHTRRGLG